LKFLKLSLFVLAAIHLLVPEILAETEGKPLWELGVIGGAFSLPYYRGSNEQRQRLLPLPYFVYRGKLLQSKDGKLNLGVDNDRLSYGISIFIQPPNDDSQARSGMEELGAILEVGPALTYKWYLKDDHTYYHSARLRAAIAFPDSHPHYAGLQFEALSGAYWFLDQNKKQQLSLNARALFGDKKLHDYYYSVDSSETLIDRPSYQAKSGYSGAALDLSYRIQPKPSHSVVGFLRYDNLEGAKFIDSPLVKQNDNISLGLIYIYRFKASKQMVNSN